MLTVRQSVTETPARIGNQAGAVAAVVVEHDLRKTRETGIARGWSERQLEPSCDLHRLTLSLSLGWLQALAWNLPSAED
jgi:hypothetical protein